MASITNAKKPYSIKSSRKKMFYASQPVSRGSSKLVELRQRLSEEKNREDEEKNYELYKERYNKSIAPTIDELESILVYLLSREDIDIEKDYNYYSIRLDIKTKNAYNTSINLRVGAEYFEAHAESTQYYNVNIQNNTLYFKYEKELEKRFFECLNNRAKKVIESINDLTNISRKNKISKLIEKDKK